MKDVKDLTDLEFGNLLKECCERLEMESKECVRIKDTFFSYFMLQLDNDEMDEIQVLTKNNFPIKVKEFICIPRTEILLDADY